MKKYMIKQTITKENGESITRYISHNRDYLDTIETEAHAKMCAAEDGWDCADSQEIKSFLKENECVIAFADLFGYTWANEIVCFEV